MDLPNGYKVLMQLKEKDGCATYRVRGADGLLYVLKTGMTAQALEMAHLHPLWVETVDGCAVWRFVSGETMDMRLRRDRSLPPAEAVRVAECVLSQLSDIHAAGFTHGAVDATNVIMDMSLTPPAPWLIGTGAARPSADVAADLKGVACLLWHMIFGEQPQTPPRVPAVAVDGLSQHTLNTIYCAMSADFPSASEMLASLRGQTPARRPSRPIGDGFAAVAGMDSLKQRLREDVLEVIADPEGAAAYGIQVPNGMLLYGPPGCGKTFIAEKFAEEACYNFRYVKSSDLASTYLHGSQEKIAALFNEARAQAPTILCFDEFDALVPRRDDVNNASHSAEVNEFLSQLNNCGADSVFVIASTNRPDRIDPAVLRTGRIDYMVYVPVPDRDARRALFDLSLKGKPVSPDIDTAKLAAASEGYIASDIIAVVQDAARQAFRARAPITAALLWASLRARKPSLSPSDISGYEALRTRFEKGTATQRPRVGFT